MVLAAVHTVETLDLNYAVLAEDYIRHSASLADNVVAVVAVVLHTEVVVAERCCRLRILRIRPRTNTTDICLLL